MHFKCYFSPHFLKLPYKAIPSSFCGWICFKLDQRVPRHYIFTNYNLDHPIWRSVAGETAGSVKFDGPSVPSKNCCSSCSSTTGAIPLLFVYSSCPCTILQCLISFQFGVLPKRQKETPKRKRLQFGLHLGHFHPWWRGDKNGNPLKVNISWIMVIFLGF